jgi:hypothetical protein
MQNGKQEGFLWLAFVVAGLLCAVGFVASVMLWLWPVSLASGQLRQTYLWFESGGVGLSLSLGGRPNRYLNWSEAMILPYLLQPLLSGVLRRECERADDLLLKIAPWPLELEHGGGTPAIPRLHNETGESCSVWGEKRSVRIWFHRLRCYGGTRQTTIVELDSRRAWA